MSSKIAQSMAFLNEMMESIPNSVDKEFSSEVKKAFTVKKIKDSGKKYNVILKGSDKEIVSIFEKFLYAFVKAYVTSSGGQVGGGGNSPNQIVPYNSRVAVRNTLRHILTNWDLYATGAVVVWNGILVYMGAQEIHRILSTPLAHTYNSQNQPMGTDLVIHGEGGNQVAVIDLTNIRIRPISLYDVLRDPRGALAEIQSDLTLQLTQARNNAMTAATEEIRRQFDLRSTELMDKWIKKMGLTEGEAARFRRVAGVRNILSGEQFGRMGEDAVIAGSDFFEDTQRDMRRAIENASVNIKRKVRNTGTETVRNIQDAFSMVSVGSIYFISIGLVYMVQRCLRRRSRGRRTYRTSALENQNNGPEFEYLNNNPGNYGGGKRTRRKRKHKKNKKSRKHRIRRKKSRKSRKSRRSKK